MDVYDIRFINLKALRRNYDTINSFAAQCEMLPSNMSKLLSKSATRNIGSKAARQIEKACGKPRGWLDINHSTASASDISVEEIAAQFSALLRETSIIVEDYISGRISRERQREALNDFVEILESINAKTRRQGS